MIAREWHCDGPECNTHTQATAGTEIPFGWFVLIGGTGSSTKPERAGDFCSMDCVLKYAGTFEPMIEIDAN